MAVEILLEQGYNHLCDYWSLGVILYELVYGSLLILILFNAHKNIEHVPNFWTSL
jgi:serine/threonine protein kinase